MLLFVNRAFFLNFDSIAFLFTYLSTMKDLTVYLRRKHIPLNILSKNFKTKFSHREWMKVLLMLNVMKLNYIYVQLMIGETFNN